MKAANSYVYHNFGYSVALSGDTLAVGANFEDSSQTTITNSTSASSNKSNNDSGAVFVYRRTSRHFEVADLYMSSPATGEAVLTWKGTWGSATQVVIAESAGDTAPADCGAGSGGVNFGTVFIKTFTGLSAGRHTFRVCTTDGTTMTYGIVMSVTVL